ncbi:MAG TPA: TetR/AcrR family transcriptional regulator [Bryobacteraceae bacterium]|nr:TetR/AcrR family transcriptional regulator [Bryobacteraceae bacterium]
MLGRVNVHTHPAQEPRRVPQQPRGERRVAQLLHGAASVIAEVGYEPATMSAIAERARAPIGSLYQFFPNKQAITHALRTEYGKDYDARLAALESEAKHLSLQHVVARLITLTVGFVESHPAFLALLDAPSATRSPASLRRTLRHRLAGCFTAVCPRTARAKSLALAAVTLQVMKGLTQLYAEASSHERRQYIREYRAVLFSYLAARLEPERSRENE